MIVAVPDAQLEALAALRPADPPRAARRQTNRDEFDVRAWLAAHDLAIEREKPWIQGATVLELAACVFADAHEHHRGEAAVIVLASGMLLYKCQHATCVGRDWPQVREHFEGPRRSHVYRGGSGRITPSETAADIRLTDLGNARRLVSAHGEDLRYCKPWRSWLVWDERRWRRDDRDEVMWRAKRVVTDLLRAAADLPMGDAQKALVQHALQSQRTERLRGMILLAQSELGIPVLPTELDADPWLLNVENGTIDLRTGRRRPHDRHDLLTKLAPVTYDPTATLELWDWFLGQATGGNENLTAFLSRATGYTLTGDTSEEVLFFLHGPEAAGKSTFAEAIKSTLGDYAKVADFETFIQKRGDGGIRNDIARLAGARLVVSVEVDEGKRLAEGLVKQLTGGDTVAARFLWSEAFEFEPQFTLWLAANHAPKVHDTDGALWRRILRVPFEHTVPKEQRDKTVKARLKEPTRAGPAILAWAVRGCLEWQRNGLGIPPEVTAATASYRESQDPLRDFFAECCIFVAAAWTASARLYAAYKDWATENGWRELVSPTALGLRLRARGCTPQARWVEVAERKKKPRGWCGIALQDDPSVQVEPVPEADFRDLFHGSSREREDPESGVPTCTNLYPARRCPRCGGPEWTPAGNGRPGHCASCGDVPGLEREPGEEG